MRAVAGFASVVAVLVSVLMYYAELTDINNVGWQLFYLPKCPACIKQLTVLGLRKYTIYKTDCSTKIEECKNMGITSFPTWVNVYSGKKEVGIRTHMGLLMSV